MKTLILYATKYGATREIAERIADRITGSTVCDLKSDSVPPIDQYDCVIIGSSLYAGMIRKEAKAYFEKNVTALLGKTVGLFLSGLNGENETTYFTTNIPDDLLKCAKATAFPGGVFSPKKCSFAERLIMKAAAKTTSYTHTISDEKIARFVEALSA